MKTHYHTNIDTNENRIKHTQEQTLSIKHGTLGQLCVCIQLLKVFY